MVPYALYTRNIWYLKRPQTHIGNYLGPCGTGISDMLGSSWGSPQKSVDFLKLGFFFGSPQNKDYSIWGSMLGSPIWEINMDYIMRTIVYWGRYWGPLL